MIKESKHIEIVRSSIIELSSMSQLSCDAILEVLSKYYSKVRVSVVDNITDLEALVDSRPDLVFMGMEFVYDDSLQSKDKSNKVWLSDYLDKHEIAYTGSDQSAHELQRNKPLAKQRVQRFNLKTSPYCVIKKGQVINDDNFRMNFPVFIKPTDRGGGLGINADSIAFNFKQLQLKVRSINNKYDSAALVEEYLPGREFSVAILKEELSDDYLVMPIELVAPKNQNGYRLLSGYVKSSNSEQALAVDNNDRSKVIELAIEVFKVLGARDYGRIDIRLDANGTPNFLEANLIPSLISGYGSFPKACQLNNKIDYESMILRITKLGLARNNAVVLPLHDSLSLDDDVYTSKEIVFDQL